MLIVAVNLALLNINSVSKIAFELLRLGYYVRNSQAGAIINVHKCNTEGEEFSGLR